MTEMDDNLSKYPENTSLGLLLMRYNPNQIFVNRILAAYVTSRLNGQWTALLSPSPSLGQIVCCEMLQFPAVHTILVYEVYCTVLLDLIINNYLLFDSQECF